MGVHIFCIDNCNPIFENVTVKSNPSVLLDDEPISIYEYSNPVFINCIIENNHINPAESGFGAICCVAQSKPILLNTKIVNNSDYETSGIGVYNGFYDEGPILINCTICNNSNCSEGVINQTSRTNVTLINCIFRNPAEDEIWFDYQGNPNTVTISYTNIDGGIDAINTNNNGTIHWLEGNIDSLPQFVGGDPFSYELLSGSPCIDAGNPDTTGLNLPPTDLAGNPRIYNGIIDMGAYEWQINGAVDKEDKFYKNLYLFQNKPNPFSTSTTITFISADYERLRDYKLSIYNAKGQLIRTYNGKRDNFWVKTDIVWDGTDEDGNKVSPGVYFYKLSYGKNSVTKKMILLK
ncbi:MAG: T9SS type A sorting domain-containing protein [Candidatus Cloacimonetes bacterium]|nr:T9SS type A sorting domain-containing protein [Candidatus Cloacimonadota bacterium]MCK4359254.1 T9SS type A sorting domain-containing protein [Candidatus Cloacimonadota bacterium]